MINEVKCYVVIGFVTIIHNNKKIVKCKQPDNIITYMAYAAKDTWYKSLPQFIRLTIALSSVYCDPIII